MTTARQARIKNLSGHEQTKAQHLVRIRAGPKDQIRRTGLSRVEAVIQHVAAATIEGPDIKATLRAFESKLFLGLNLSLTRPPKSDADPANRLIRDHVRNHSVRPWRIGCPGRGDHSLGSKANGHFATQLSRARARSLRATGPGQ
ncbi:MAG: hypothetical protein CMH55_10690 [Myxococcales bacterium]|nr:hypothetical protein [Myxococcales bacterium]